MVAKGPTRTRVRSSTRSPSSGPLESLTYRCIVRAPAAVLGGWRAMSFFRKAYSIVGALLLLDVLVQFFFIGAAIFTIFGEANNGVAAQKALDDSGFYVIAHVLNGAAMAVLILLLVGLSFGARYPWRTTGLPALLFLLLALQSLLAHTGIA